MERAALLVAALVLWSSVASAAFFAYNVLAGGNPPRKGGLH